MRASCSTDASISNCEANGSFGIRFGIREQRLALPQRSPNPLRVPWIWRTPAPHRGQRHRHRLLGVVMGMDAQRRVGQPLLHRADDAIGLFGHDAAIGIAEHDPFGAGVMGRLDAGKGVVAVGLPAVEEMLGIEQGSRFFSTTASMERAILSIFSARVMPPARLPPGSRKSCPRGRPASALELITWARDGSLSALRPERLVMPKAVKRACLSGGRSRKKAVSVGLAPGQPPSI